MLNANYLLEIKNRDYKNSAASVGFESPCGTKISGRSQC